MITTTCDTCGAERGAAEGWYEVVTWAEPSYHACSAECLQKLGEQLEGANR